MTKKENEATINIRIYMVLTNSYVHNQHLGSIFYLSVSDPIGLITVGNPHTYCLVTLGRIPRKPKTLMNRTSKQNKLHEISNNALIDTYSHSLQAVL